MCTAGKKAIVQIPMRRSLFYAGADFLLCMRQRNLSAWAYHRILKPGRTITGKSGSKQILSAHPGDRLQYKSKLMMG
jgi:predicted ATPase with chaperone activity